MKTTLVFLMSTVLSATSVWAQPVFELERIATPPQPDAVPLYEPGEIPEGEVEERWGLLRGQISPDLVIEARIARNVTRPTLTPVLPDPDLATGLGVIVAPGGAFQSLSMDHEGFTIAERLAQRGIAAFVLKYRLNETPDNEEAFMERLGKIMSSVPSPDEQPAVTEPRAGADALQALRLIRARAGEWQVDPARIGLIGFSAGAMTGLQAVLTGQPEQQPDFLGYIYGPMVAIDVPDHAPPMFAAIALDDGLFAGQGFGIVTSWRDAGIPVELHAYERGGHGFGAGQPGTTTMGVINQFVAWLESRGLISR